MEVEWTTDKPTYPGYHFAYGAEGEDEDDVYIRWIQLGANDNLDTHFSRIEIPEPPDLTTRPK